MVDDLQAEEIKKSKPKNIERLREDVRRSRFAHVCSILDNLGTSVIIVNPAFDRTPLSNGGNRFLEIINTDITCADLEGYPEFTRWKSRVPVVSGCLERTSCR